MSVKDIILGYKFQDLKSNKALNAIILLSKYYIYTSYITEKNISLKSFFIKFKQYVDIFKSLKTKDLAHSVVERVFHKLVRNLNISLHSHISQHTVVLYVLSGCVIVYCLFCS